MNIEQIKERFRLTPEEANRMEEFLKKAANAQVLFCQNHDREFFDFEGECPVCIAEKLEFQESVKSCYDKAHIEDIEDQQEKS